MAQRIRLGEHVVVQVVGPQRDAARGVDFRDHVAAQVVLERRRVSLGVLTVSTELSGSCTNCTALLPASSSVTNRP